MKEVLNKDEMDQEILDQDFMEEVVEEDTVSEDTKNIDGCEHQEEQDQEEADLKASKKAHKADKKKDKKHDPMKEKVEELEDKVRRQMAEFDNFRKRSEKEKSQMFEIGAKSIVEKILPVIDNFERGLAIVPEELKNSPYVEGMDKIYRQLIGELESVGVKAIEAVGTVFDPFYHNAVMHVEDEEINENVVVEEFQKGYVYRETVVRHSMVKVAN